MRLHLHVLTKALLMNLCWGMAQLGKTPGTLFSLPNNDTKLIWFDSKEMAAKVRIAEPSIIDVKAGPFHASHQHAWLT